MFEWLVPMLKTYGPLGAFIVSALGNAIPYSTVPYLFAIAAWGAGISDPLGKFWLTVAGAVGAALGKLAVYYIGRGARAITSAETMNQFERFSRLFSRGIFIAVFAFAALPLPDDLLYVPLGVAKYNVAYFFLAVFLGKLVITGLSVFFGTTLANVMETTSSISPLLSITIGISATIIATLVVIKTDWNRIMVEYEEKGGLHALIRLLIEFFAVFVRFFKWLYKKTGLGKNNTRKKSLKPLRGDEDTPMDRETMRKDQPAEPP